MEVTELGMLTEESWLQPEKRPLLIEVIVLGKVMPVRLLQFWNAYSPIEDT